MLDKKNLPASRRRFFITAAIGLALLAALGVFWRFSYSPDQEHRPVGTTSGGTATQSIPDQSREEMPFAASSQEAESTRKAAVEQKDEFSSTPEDQVGGPTVQSLGTFQQWSTVEVPLKGPESSGMSTSENPFRIPVEVTFTGPDGKAWVVQAFYDGDGAGGLEGSLWKARFSPDATGEWYYASTSSQSVLNGQEGSFTVKAPGGCESYQPGSLPDFSCQGRLEYSGDRYLKFADGVYWLKGGADEPEDFLAQGSKAGFNSQEEAVNFLAGKGVNSIYLLLSNIDGDGDNVWPWLGDTSAAVKADTEHFDLSKLAGWESIFTRMQAQGLVLHLVLEDDSGWTGFDRSLYYREMVARFAHHNGLIWNISEEYNENYSPDQAQEFARTIRELDPYDHPITIHNQGSPDNWEPFLGSPQFDLTSLQTTASPQYETAAAWLSKVEGSGRIIPVSFDETGQLEPGQRDLARQIVWSVYLGGANYEMFTQLRGGYTEFAGHFEDMRRARAFLEGLPFPQMRPLDGLLAGEGYVFAKPGEVYAVYLPEGQTVIALDLSMETETLEAAWVNPRADERIVIGTVEGDASRFFTAPDSQDWVLLLQTAPASSNP